MPEYLLDTGVLNGYLRGRPKIVALVDPWIAAGQASTSTLVYGEIVEYLQGLADYARREAELRALLHDVRLLQLSYAVMRRYATLRREMRQPYGTGLIGDVDTLIAATALEHQVVVVTLDGDFSRVPGLRMLLLRRDILR